MSDRDGSSERKHNLWAPWRMEYINSLAGDGDGCFLCDYRDRADRDAENFVLWRSRRCLVMLNRFPYTGGHSMVAPTAHAADLADLDAETMREMMEHVRDLQLILAHALRAEGFNVGMNIGRCAGAGLPGHLHVHVVPRWSGDTNFMPVTAGTSVIPQSPDALYARLQQAGEELGLPKR